MAGAGTGFTTTFTDVAPVQPFASVTVTPYGPAVETVMVPVVWPVLHAYEAYGPAFSTELAPWQKAVVPAMAGTGLEFIVTSCASLPVQPLASVTVTVYVFPAATVMLAAVEPVFHEYPAMPAGAFNWVLVPWQNAKLPVMFGTGNALTTRTAFVEAVHPKAFVTVTVYVPEVPGVMVCVVAPLFHAYDAKPAPPFSSVVVPEQMLRSPVMAGTGKGFTTTLTEVVPEHPLPSVTVTA
jgi:hypothetical protein